MRLPSLHGLAGEEGDVVGDLVPSDRRVGASTGFSLLEVVLVLTIVAIVAVMAVPRYSASQGRYRADLAARRIVADLAMAQARAKALSASQTVTFDAANRYTIVGMADLDHPAATYQVDLSAVPYQGAIVSAIFGPGSTLVFNGYGVPSSGGTVVVQAAEVIKTIVIDPDSGTATIQ